MSHSPVFKKLFIQLFPQHSDFVEFSDCLFLVDDALTPQSIFQSKTLKEAKEIAARQVKIDTLKKIGKNEKKS